MRASAATMALGVLVLALGGTEAFAQEKEAPQVGSVTVVEGAGRAVRKANDGKGKPEPLKVGTPIRVGDHLETAAGVRLKLTLNDQSVLMLDEKSRLQIDAADFADQTGARSGFWSTLGVGAIWSKVAKTVAGSDAKFEVRTERAVAGVRGTEFWVEAFPIVRDGKPSQRTRVQVSEGVVAVESTAAVRLGPLTPPPLPSGAKPGRVQVPGPQEVTREAWEKRFLELQRGMVVVVDEELWVEKVDEPEPDNPFARFVRKHGGTE